MEKINTFFYSFLSWKATDSAAQRKRNRGKINSEFKYLEHKI